MSERFIKFIPGKRADGLLERSPNAFLLLSIIAKNTNRTANIWNGLGPGECYLGDWKSYGMTEREYRTAKSILLEYKIIATVETNRTRGKSTTGTTTRGTKVKIIDSTIWDLNLKDEDDLKDDSTTTQRRLNDDDQEYKEYKEHKEFDDDERVRAKKKLSQEETELLSRCIEVSQRKDLDLTESSAKRMIHTFGAGPFKKFFNETLQEKRSCDRQASFAAVLNSKLNKERDYGNDADEQRRRDVHPEFDAEVSGSA